MDRLKKRFTQVEVESLRQCVVKAESHTSGEVVPVIVGRSDRYPGVAWRSALAVTMIGAASSALALPHLESFWLVLALPVWALAGYLLAAWPAWLRFWAGESTLREEVHQRALQAFHELDLSATRDRTGVLVFISLLEHRVEIIADRGIYEKADREIWSRTVKECGQLIRGKDVMAGAAYAVESVGQILTQHFPVKPGERNEIPDRVVILDV